MEADQKSPYNTNNRILIGALVGARLLACISNKLLRILFLGVIIVAAIEMVLHGLGIAA